MTRECYKCILVAPRPLPSSRRPQNTIFATILHSIRHNPFLCNRRKMVMGFRISAEGKFGPFVGTERIQI